jgi:hypothetical protein
MQARKPVSPSDRFAALVRSRRQHQQQQQLPSTASSPPLLQTSVSKMTLLEGSPQQLAETRADLTANL